MERFKNVNKLIGPNISLDVVVPKGDYRGTYKSRIEDYDDKSIYITIPSSKGRPIPLKPKAEIEASFLTDKGRFSFETTVIKMKKGNIPLLEIKKPNIIRRKELRAFFRVETRIKIKLNVIDFKFENGIPEMLVESYDAHSKDISGGGVRLITDAAVDADQAVEILLDDKQKIHGLSPIFCKIVKVYEKNDKIDVGLDFISIRETDRDKIIKYVFKRQIELRQMSR